MKTLLLLLLVYSVKSASGTNYYFSSSSGNDSRTAKEAQNPATPWKTLGKLNSFFSSLKPGDFMLLKRGDIFLGNIIVSKSGTNTLNIAIGAYGSGAQPVVTGLVPLSWTSLGSNRYESKQQLSLASINLVTRNNVPLAMGRWPNDDQPRSGYNIISSHTWDKPSQSGKINSSGISGAPHFSNGAELVMRVKHFVIDRDHVTSYTKSSINFKADNGANIKYQPQDKYGYYLQNDPVFLDKQNEWWYSPKTKKVLIYSKTGAPPGIKATTLSEIVTVTGFSYLTFDNITFEGGNSFVLKITGNTGHITVQNCTINCSGAEGIYSASPFSTIKNNIISNCLNRSIYSKGRNAYIGHNKISNTATIIGMGNSGDGNYIGISLLEDNSLVEYNKVTKTGYIGIYLAKSCNNSTIQYNRVDSFCLVKNDGAGIYCYSRSTICRGRKVLYNIVSNGGVGNAVDGADKKYTPNNRAEGIYLDQETSGISIKYNTLFNCYRGLFLNPGCNTIDAQWNTTYNNYLYEFYLNVGSNVEPGKDPMMFGNIIKNNIYVSVKSGTGFFYSQGWSLKIAGLIDNNYYARPLDDNKTMYNMGSVITLASWKVAHPYFDLHSKKSPKSVSKSSDVFLEFNETSSPRTVKLSGKCIDVTGKAYSGSIILQPYTSIVLIKNATSVAASRAGNRDTVSNLVSSSDSAANFDTLAKTNDASSAVAIPGQPVAMAELSSIAPTGSFTNKATISELTGAKNEAGREADSYKLSNLRISPDPAVNILQLHFNGLQVQHKAILRIQSMNGGVVKQYPITLSGSKINVDVSFLQAGIYILNLSGDNFKTSKKFIKIN